MSPYKRIQPESRTREEKKGRAFWVADYTGKHVAWPAPERKTYFVWDKIKCADVVGDTRHVISLSNRFLKLINLPTSTTFLCWEQMNHGTYFSRIFFHHGVIDGQLKIWECKSYSSHLFLFNFSSISDHKLAFWFHLVLFLYLMAHKSSWVI